MIYEIKNRFLNVSVDSKGAQMISAICNGKQRTWKNADGSWSDSAPILFPVCGRCRVIIDKKDYNMPFHGFAYTSEFALKNKTKNGVELSLSSNEETKKLYPYDFIFTVSYKLVGRKVKVEYSVTNLSDKEMYFSYGAHDSFVVDGALEDYNVTFNKKENLVAYFDDNGYLTDNQRKFEGDRLLKIQNSGLVDDGSLIFKNINSNKVALVDSDCKKVAEIGFKGFSNLLLWRTRNNDMVCIEPWSNLPDESDSDLTEFSEKKGIKKVPIGNKVTIKRYVKYFG